MHSRLHAYASLAALSAAATFAADASQASGGASPPAPPAAKSTSAPAKPAAKPKLVEAIVRRGTVMIGDHGAEQPVGPGGRVKLPAEDVAALRARGILHDPEAAPLIQAGPKLEDIE